jgi:putative effector of murein hydrolase LrgA (UPF0299 family)
MVFDIALIIVAALTAATICNIVKLDIPPSQVGMMLLTKHKAKGIIVSLGSG